jgi:sec-independent protein translocase protein TatB
MFGIGMPEMILIMAIALIVIGPKKFPDLAKSLGKAFREFKRATGDLKESLHVDESINDINNTITEVNDDVKNALDFTVEDKKDPLAKPNNGEDDLKTGKTENPKGSING